jgi:hypothetical protein
MKTLHYDLFGKPIYISRINPSWSFCETVRGATGRCEAKCFLVGEASFVSHCESG